MTGCFGISWGGNNEVKPTIQYAARSPEIRHFDSHHWEVPVDRYKVNIDVTAIKS